MLLSIYLGQGINKVSKDDKNFLKVKEEVINKVKAYRNSPEFSKVSGYIEQLR